MREEKITEVLKQEKCIDFALLFGSSAKGSTHPMSDIDIALYLREPMSLLEEGALIAELESVSDRPVDLVLLNDLPQEQPKLAFSILQNHKILFQRHPEKYIEFKEQTYRHYFDQAPMFHLFDEAFIRRINSAAQ
ncbi:nucleotidyltransferase domain-containing protein [Nitratifractor sp.]|uniref:type VII toxin-antitoxin system MntA family adenylyltransferase antitoxin n=1 Tax=Nitratifractor sp. TaxID=2268144 RepID=UPI0025E0D33B|nr:nucleotidyltransferase domain-containing protein [Nitratifractor sp.]